MRDALFYRRGHIVYLPSFLLLNNHGNLRRLCVHVDSKQKHVLKTESVSLTVIIMVKLYRQADVKIRCRSFVLHCTRVQAIHGVAVILTPLVFIKQKPVEGSNTAPITLYISYKTLQLIVFISNSNICSSHLFTVKVEKVKMSGTY